MQAGTALAGLVVSILALRETRLQRIGAGPKPEPSVGPAEGQRSQPGPTWPPPSSTTPAPTAPVRHQPPAPYGPPVPGRSAPSKPLAARRWYTRWWVPLLAAALYGCLLGAVFGNAGRALIANVVLLVSVSAIWLFLRARRPGGHPVLNTILPMLVGMSAAFAVLAVMEALHVPDGVQGLVILLVLLGYAGWVIATKPWRD
jgi:hypothetical protein